jgi:glycogen debranching enzyme
MAKPVAESAPILPDTAGEAHITKRLPTQLYALKEGDTFVVADAFGDFSGEGDGLFYFDTRLLSRFLMSFGGAAPSLLSAAVSRDNVFFTSNVTNKPLPMLGGKSAPQGVLHVQRARFLWRERLYERITCVNYSFGDITVPLTFQFDADFADMFEVRGKPRPARGVLQPTDIGTRSITYRYKGLDGVLRTTAVCFSRRPDMLAARHAQYIITLRPDAQEEFYIEIGAHTAEPSRARFRDAAARARIAMRNRVRHGPRLLSSGRLFNEWMEKSRSDLALLTTEMPTGPYPYAGIPWFSTAFGRDAIISALQVLWLEPSLARGVLRFLASTQAHETSAFQDAEPGKIMHETRKGEMTALKEVPFAQYYGGVDTTPLFVVLAGAYASRTGDMSLIEELWPALNAAMEWIAHASDGTPEGFLVYARGMKSGLVNQSWKDSDDSVFHVNGRIPRGPIAAVEVQGYVYAAMRAMADLHQRSANTGEATRFREMAARMQANVEERFWMEDQGFYGIAIDGANALCQVRASNPGHLLYMGLPAPERAKRVSETLLSSQFNTGWGIRTLAPNQSHFNPMSYHNGSVWPHDTALCAAGMASYGERAGVVRLLNQMFETAVAFGMRLPELFCGFSRAPGEPPVAYPVACLPQAWAAGSFFMLLQACLGLRVDGWRGEIHVDHPHLPVGIDQLRIQRIHVNGRHTDLVFRRVGKRVVAYADGPGQGSVPLIVHA